MFYRCPGLVSLFSDPFVVTSGYLHTQIDVSLCPQTLGVPVQHDSVVRGLFGAQLGGPVECGSVQCDGGCQRAADSSLWSKCPELPAGPDSGSGPLPQQGEYENNICFRHLKSL